MAGTTRHPHLQPFWSVKSIILFSLWCAISALAGVAGRGKYSSAGISAGSEHSKNVATDPLVGAPTYKKTLKRALDAQDLYLTPLHVICTSVNVILSSVATDPDYYRPDLNGNLRPDTSPESISDPNTAISTNYIAELIEKCYDCLCDQITGAILPNSDPGSHCQNPNDVFRCQEWWYCTCLAYMKHIHREQLETKEYRNALISVPEGVKAYWQGAYQGLFRESQYIPQIFGASPGAKEQYLVSGPNEVSSKKWMTTGAANLASSAFSHSLLRLSEISNSRPRNIARGFIPPVSDSKTSERKNEGRVEPLNVDTQTRELAQRIGDTKPKRALRATSYSTHNRDPSLSPDILGELGEITFKHIKTNSFAKRVLEPSDLYRGNMQVVCPPVKNIKNLPPPPGTTWDDYLIRQGTSYRHRSEVSGWTDTRITGELMRCQVSCSCEPNTGRLIPNLVPQSTRSRDCRNEMAAMRCSVWLGCICVAEIIPMDDGLSLQAQDDWGQAYRRIPKLIRDFNNLLLTEDLDIELGLMTEEDRLYAPPYRFDAAKSKEPLRLVGPDPSSAGPTWAIDISIPVDPFINGLAYLAKKYGPGRRLPKSKVSKRNVKQRLQRRSNDLPAKTLNDNGGLSKRVLQASDFYTTAWRVVCPTVQSVRNMEPPLGAWPEFRGSNRAIQRRPATLSTLQISTRLQGCEHCNCEDPSGLMIPNPNAYHRSQQCGTVTQARMCADWYGCLCVRGIGLPGGDIQYTADEYLAAWDQIPVWIRNYHELIRNENSHIAAGDLHPDDRTYPEVVLATGTKEPYRLYKADNSNTWGIDISISGDQILSGLSYLAKKFGPGRRLPQSKAKPRPAKKLIKRGDERLVQSGITENAKMHKKRVIFGLDFYRTNLRVICPTYINIARLQPPRSGWSRAEIGGLVLERPSLDVLTVDEFSRWLQNIVPHCSACWCDQVAGNIIVNPGGTDPVAECASLEFVTLCRQWFGCTCVAEMRIPTEPDGQMIDSQELVQAWREIPEGAREYFYTRYLEEIAIHVGRMDDSERYWQSFEQLRDTEKPRHIYGPASPGGNKWAIDSSGWIRSSQLAAIAGLTALATSYGPGKHLSKSKISKRGLAKRVLSPQDFYVSPLRLFCPPAADIMRMQPKNLPGGVWPHIEFRDGPDSRLAPISVGYINHRLYRCFKCECVQETAVIVTNPNTGGPDCKHQWTVDMCIYWFGCFCATSLQMPPGSESISTWGFNSVYNTIPETVRNYFAYKVQEDQGYGYLRREDGPFFSDKPKSKQQYILHGAWDPASSLNGIRDNQYLISDSLLYGLLGMAHAYGAVSKKNLISIRDVSSEGHGNPEDLEH